MKLAKEYKLSLFPLVMINITAIASLRNLTFYAEFGYKILFFLGLALLLFFLPSALVVAELSTTWPKRGGVYLWVREAFGEKWGFLAIWLQWIHNVICYPTFLSFLAANLAYAFMPQMAHNPYFYLAVILITIWTFTLLNFLGMKASGWISSFGGILGNVVPAAALFILGLLFFTSSEPPQIPFSKKAFLPSFEDINHWIYFLGALLSLTGMEMFAAHAQDVENPQKNYPRAILFSSVSIGLIYLLGSFAIVLVVPVDKLSLCGGLNQAFEAFFAEFRLPSLSKLFAIFLAFGAIAMANSWLIGPSKSLISAARHGDLPSFFRKENKHHVPTSLLFLQAIIISALASLFLFTASLNACYWLLTALTAQIYLIMYILLFLAAIRLRYKFPHTTRPYKIPGGNPFLITIASLAILVSLFAMIIGFFPPSNIVFKNVSSYYVFLAICLMAFTLLPLFFQAKGKKSK